MKYAFFILCFFTSYIMAQTDYTLKGRVLDEASGKPLSNVNVYISSSLLGAMTNDSGYYKITGIHQGQFEVVASLVGYEPESHIMFFDIVRQQTKDFRLNPKTYVLEGVSVTAKDPKQWRDNYNLFRGLFLGKSQFTDECEIENKELIEFKWESFDVMTAKAGVPLIINNKALGYKISCILDKFRWDKANKMVNYIIKPGFSLMQPNIAKDTVMWGQNRTKAYEFSIERFLSSLISNDYYQKGYRIYLDPFPLTDNYSSLSSERISAEELLSKRSSVKGEEYALKFKGYLRIEYNHETTWLRLLYPEITMDKNGNVRELIPFQVFGAWTTLGVANMLPQYFVAE